MKEVLTGTSTDEIIKVLKPLSSVPWSLRHPLWRHLILIPNDQGNMLYNNEQKDKRRCCLPGTFVDSW